ncbi:hypothetical protein ATANTOWER_030637 [Ataeniobius toweri]|uniref:Uncharacterized protein n=1 Tax=Ataeniobius toweri TaxID=208326 RepID=A0ABU7AWD7_9TELE|nr:hypothetical protein [Ataeniobius toweri]
MTMKMGKLRSQVFKSLGKAAVTIPLLPPTKYSQTFVKLRIYCCFTAYCKPVFSLVNASSPSFTPSSPKSPHSPAKFLLRDKKKQCSQKTQTSKAVLAVR